MMNTEEIRVKTCPHCGAIYGGVSALSRQDNETLICPDCGTREALESLGISTKEKESILEIIHRNQNK